jgi:predicted MFS family arabinose efflux permease
MSDQVIPANDRSVRRSRDSVLGPTLVFAGVAAAFASMFVAAGAPTPLLVRLQQSWGFPVSLLTIAFAAYAVGLLGALLTLGSLSDFVGRKPVLLLALSTELIAMIMFLLAGSVEWLIAARFVQGAATGAATAAFSAALIELAPLSRRGAGAVFGAVAPAGGLAIGALLTGVAIQFTTAPNAIVFGFLTVTMAADLAIVALAAETAERRSGARAALRPHLAVPANVRRSFVAVVPLQIAAWMLAGLYLGLIPSIIRGILGIDSGLLNGTTAFIEPAAAAVAAFAFGRIDPRATTRFGARFLVGGSVLVLIGIVGHSIALLWLGGAIGGIGFGAAFSGPARSMAQLVRPDERAGLFAAVFVVAYLAFGIPVVIAGQAADRIGLAPAATAYVLVLLGVAVVALLAESWQASQRGIGSISETRLARRVRGVFAQMSRRTRS